MEKHLEHLKSAEIHPSVVSFCLSHLYKAREILTESAEVSKDDRLYLACAELDSLASVLHRLLT